MAGPSVEGTLPTIVLDGNRLVDIRQRLQSGHDAALQTSLELLLREADKWLPQGPWSVMEKTKAPPSGDMHDYTSQAPYYWPSPTPDGNPYVQRDGERNPEVLKYSDRVNIEKVLSASSALVLAWFYTGREAYSHHAARIIRTWFIDPTTRMNPNLNHAQLIPFANTGRHIGIIDFSQWYTTLLDMAVLLDCGAAPGWTADDTEGFREWNRGFLGWLTESEFGRAERAEKNNHGCFASLMVAAIALYVGDTALVKREAEAIRRDIDETIAPDGALPGELVRTRSWHYANFTLLALTRLAMVVGKVGEDLWGYRGPQGQGITRAIQFILPAATGDAEWGFGDLQFRRFAAADVIRAAADAGHEASRLAVDRIERPEGDLWLLRPAPEQLEPVKSGDWSHVCVRHHRISARGGDETVMIPMDWHSHTYVSDGAALIITFAHLPHITAFASMAAEGIHDVNNPLHILNLQRGRDLLREYSRVSAGDFDAHVTVIRDKASEVAPYRCVRRFRFLDLVLKSTDVYNEVLERVKRGEKFLDLACGLGQELRQIVSDGAPSANTYGCDLHGGFFPLGYELFKDEDRLQTTFVQADVFDDTSPLVEMSGQMDIIYVGDFFHLFDLGRQEKVATRLVQLLVPRPGSLVVGRQAGSETPGEHVRSCTPAAPTHFRHDPKSWRELWERVGERTGSSWDVRAELVSEFEVLSPLPEGLSREMQRLVEARGLRYTVRRL